LAWRLAGVPKKLAEREEELRIANEHLEELASLDGLTGLANRRGFDRQLEQEWRRAGEINEPVALMMIDIDHFKLYNDRYGHVAGDTCLRSVGETLSLVTLENCVLVARYGGEEFALLLPGLDLPRIASLAEEARRSIEDLLITHAEAPCGHVTISIGVESLVPKTNQTAADLVEAADRALYAAKRRGRNRVDANVPTLVSTSEPAPRTVYESPPLVASRLVSLTLALTLLRRLRRRPDHGFELHAVGIGEIDRVIAVTVIFARRIEHGHAVLLEKGAEIVHRFAAGQREGVVVKADVAFAIFVLLALRVGGGDPEQGLAVAPAGHVAVFVF